MNLQHCLAAGPRIRLEHAGVPELYTEISVRSFETCFLWRGQLDEQSIRRLLDEVCSWLMLVKRAHGPLGRRGEAVPGPTHISEKTTRTRLGATRPTRQPHAIDVCYIPKFTRLAVKGHGAVALARLLGHALAGFRQPVDELLDFIQGRVPGRVHALLREAGT